MELHKAQELALELMKKHGLGHWSFRFDHARRRFGCCHLDKRIISLSFRITALNNEEAVRDTILHEIAHALSPMMGHGEIWKAKCMEIGANPSRCYGDEVATPALAWKGTCPVCGLIIKKSRKPRFKSWHRHCGNVGQLIVWERNSF